MQLFDFQCLIDLHVLGCSEQDLTISGICLSVCDKNFVASVAQKLMDRISWNFIFSYPSINWYLSTFGENRPIGGAVDSLFSEILGYAHLGF